MQPWRPIIMSGNSRSNTDNVIDQTGQKCGQIFILARSAPLPRVCQILNFENWTIIKGDTAIFVKACQIPNPCVLFCPTFLFSLFYGVVTFHKGGSQNTCSITDSCCNPF